MIALGVLQRQHMGKRDATPGQANGGRALCLSRCRRVAEIVRIVLLLSATRNLLVSSRTPAAKAKPSGPARV